MGRGKDKDKGKGQDKAKDPDKTKDEGEDEKDQKAAGPILGYLVVVVGAISALATGLGALTSLLDLPFSLRLWATGAFASLAILSVFWKIGESLKVSKASRQRKRALSAVLAILGGVVLWLVLVVAMVFKCVEFNQQASSPNSGLLRFRAAYLPETVNVSLSVRQDATLRMRVTKAPSGRLQFLNLRSYGSDILLTDFGDREEAVLSYQTESLDGRPPEIFVEPHPEKQGTGWLSGETIHTKKRWFGGAGVGICIVGWLLLSYRSS